MLKPLNQKEFAKYLKVSDRTLRRYRDFLESENVPTGEIPGKGNETLFIPECFAIYKRVKEGRSKDFSDLLSSELKVIPTAKTTPVYSPDVEDMRNPPLTESSRPQHGRHAKGIQFLNPSSVPSSDGFQGCESDVQEDSGSLSINAQNIKTFGDYLDEMTNGVRRYRSNLIAVTNTEQEQLEDVREKVIIAKAEYELTRKVEIQENAKREHIADEMGKSQDNLIDFTARLRQRVQ
jgi:predicted DNA-binding protein (UPF0251 family)